MKMKFWEVKNQKVVDSLKLKKNICKQMNNLGRDNSEEKGLSYAVALNLMSCRESHYRLEKRL